MEIGFLLLLIIWGGGLKWCLNATFNVWWLLIDSAWNIGAVVIWGGRATSGGLGRKFLPGKLVKGPFQKNPLNPKT